MCAHAPRPYGIGFEKARCLAVMVFREYMTFTPRRQEWRNVFELSRLQEPNSLRELSSGVGLYVLCPHFVLSCLTLSSSLHRLPRSLGSGRI